LRTKEQGTHLTLNEHDDDDEKGIVGAAEHRCVYYGVWWGCGYRYRITCASLYDAFSPTMLELKILKVCLIQQ